MKKTDRTLNDEMRSEYDSAAMKGGVRAKYLMLVQPERRKKSMAARKPRP
jgi:hypothetical protein